MFDYTIEPNADEESFYKICRRIEAMSGIAKEDLLTDVDGSQIQYYRRNGKVIKVYNDYDVGAIYIKSEEPIENI